MIVLNTKNFNELQQESLEELEALGFSSNKGSIARLFLSIINTRVAAAYRALTVNHIRAFLSTSSGSALDAIGVLLNCFRNGDDDEKFRYRISKQCLVLATSNETAVRLTAYSVEGVNDAFIKPWAMGAGTFAILIVPESSVMNTEKLLEDVKDTVSETCAYGIKFLVQVPTLTRLKLGYKLYIKDTVSDSDMQTIRYGVRDVLSDYIANLQVGQALMIDQLTQEIMNVSDDIVSHENTMFSINNKKALYVNQSVRWFEKFALSMEPDALVIT